MSRRSLVGALAILAIAAAIFSLIRTSQRQPVSVATGLMQSLSNVGAEQVAKLLDHRGKIIVVGMADCNDCVLGAELRRLFAPSVNHRRGMQVLATEVVAIGGDGKQGLPARVYTELLQRYPDANAIVSLVGAPLARPDELSKRSAKLVVILPAGDGESVRGLVERKAVDLAIIPRTTRPANAPKIPKTVQEIFEFNYEIVGGDAKS
jgi:hypothetical protein